MALHGHNGPASWPFCHIAGAILCGLAAHSSGNAGSLYSGGDEAPFTSGVPHHTPPDLAFFSAPPLSHTHSLREPGEGRRLRDRVMLIIKGRQQTHHNIYIYMCQDNTAVTYLNTHPIPITKILITCTCNLSSSQLYHHTPDCSKLSDLPFTTLN